MGSRLTRGPNSDQSGRENESAIETSKAAMRGPTHCADSDPCTTQHEATFGRNKYHEEFTGDEDHDRGDYMDTCEDESECESLQVYEDAMGEDIYGPEFDLHTSPRGKACPKHPGHEGFIPIREFNVGHVPENYPEREKCFYTLKSLANRVVHISVSKVSSDRPCKFPFFKHKGKSACRTGSGFVKDLTMCGLSGQGDLVAANGIENRLEEYRVSELISGIPDRLSKSLLGALFIPGFALVVNFERCLKEWIATNVIDSSGNQCYDNFTRDLIQQIKKRSPITLNEYRKSRDLSVSDFCLALTRGLRADSPIRFFWEHVGPIMDKPCPCRECLQSGSQQKIWGMVRVETAAHVIYDQQEADGAKVSLFYDDDVSKPVVMHGIPCAHPGVSNKAFLDSCTFMCSLHDGDVFIWRKMNAVTRFPMKISDILMRGSFPVNLTVNPNGGTAQVAPLPVAVIAHPHGSTKHISFGDVAEKSAFARWVYTAPTCPGSSGGLVTGILDSSSLIPAKNHSKAMDSHRSANSLGSDTVFKVL